MTPPPPISTLFPYTTLFRSEAVAAAGVDAAEQRVHEAVDDLPPEAGADDVGDRAVIRARRSRKEPVERSEEHTSELQSLRHLVCRLLLEKKKKKNMTK